MAERHGDNRGRGTIAGGLRPVRGLWEMLDWVARAWAVVMLLGIILAAALVVAKAHEARIDLLVCTVLVAVAVPLLKARGVPDVAAGVGFFALIVAIVIAFHSPIEEAIHSTARQSQRLGRPIADNPTSQGRGRTQRTSTRSVRAPRVPRHESRNPAGAAAAASIKSRSESSPGSSGSPPASTTGGEEGASKGTQQSHSLRTTHVQPPAARVPHAKLEEADEASPAKTSPTVKVGSAGEPSHGPVIEN